MYMETCSFSVGLGSVLQFVKLTHDYLEGQPAPLTRNQAGHLACGQKASFLSSSWLILLYKLGCRRKVYWVRQTVVLSRIWVLLIILKLVSLEVFSLPINKKDFLAVLDGT